MFQLHPIQLKTKEYAQVNEVRSYEEFPIPGEIMSSYATVYFRYTTKAFQDEREVYGVFALLSDVGGFI